MQIFCLISVLLLLTSCQQEADLPNSYEITFINHYFEAINLLEIADIKVENIEIGENKVFNNICAGVHSISLETYSGLRIGSTASLLGSNPVVRITIIETGKLLLE
jgi:hypothetical protein